MLFDEAARCRADILALGSQQDIGNHTAGKHLIGDAAIQYGLHHEECICDFCAAQHEYTRASGCFHQGRNHAVFLFEQSSHCRGKQLFEAAQGWLIPMRGCECVTHIVIGQRCERAYNQSICLLCMRQLEAALEQCLFFGHKSNIVQQQYIARP